MIVVCIIRCVIIFSYSRQNLLSTSTKSNEGLQNTSSESRSFNTIERSNSYTLPTIASFKLNREHQTSSNPSVESTPRRKRCFKTFPASSSDTIDIVHNIGTDVMNANQNDSHENCVGNSSSLHHNSCRLMYHSNTNVQSDNVNKDCSDHRYNLCRNVLQNSHDNQRSLEALYSSELRESIFRGISNLIAANEERPHFLIQLLKDLQRVQSDHLRCRILQSIQTLITTETAQNSREEVSSCYLLIEPLY